MDAITVGEVIDARYRIESMIGEGGMCKVFRATHLLLQKPVAIKVLNPLSLLTRDAVVRFKREAEAVARLSHPNIVEGFGFGTLGERPYMVLEYIQGRSLAALLAERGALDEAEFVRLVRQICAGLQHAHEHGIVHRDLKPSNVMITNDGVVKLVDFGIAQLLPVTGAEMQKLTQTGEVFGTFKYMSPEQCMGRATDARSDVYSLGCMMYEMLTGRTPFDGATSWDVMSKHLSQTMPIDAGLGKYGQVIRACLSKDPGGRPASVQALMDAMNGAPLESARRGESSPTRQKSPARVFVPLLMVACLMLGGALFFGAKYKTSEKPVDPQSAIYEIYERAARDGRATADDVRLADELGRQAADSRRSRVEALIAAIAAVCGDDDSMLKHVRLSKDPKGSFDDLQSVADELAKYKRYDSVGALLVSAGDQERVAGNVTRAKQFWMAAGMHYATAKDRKWCIASYELLPKLDVPGEHVHRDLADTWKLCTIGSFIPVDQALREMDAQAPQLESRKDFPNLCRCELHFFRAMWLAQLGRYSEAEKERAISDEYGQQSIAAAERYGMDAKQYMNENAKQQKILSPH